MAGHHSQPRRLGPPESDLISRPESSHGGARPGSGRKPKAVRYANEVAAQEGRIVAALPELIDLLLGAARAGDTSAARYLVDRVLGRVQTQAKPVAEDYSMPWDAPPAGKIAEILRRRELAKELVPRSTDPAHVRAVEAAEHLICEEETSDPDLTAGEVDRMQARHLERARVLAPRPPPPPSPFVTARPEE